MTVPGDNPITSRADDLLDRDQFAEQFVSQVFSLDRSQGLVVGVLGAWGFGKTSFVNLARPRLESGGAVILEFNPWMFSGADQLVESFFVELASQLKVRDGLTDVGRQIEEYGEAFAGLAWLPLVGPWIARGRGATKLVGKILQRRQEGVSGRRERLRIALLDANKPIAIVLDDVDRLSTSEIRDVFKLVRLTASFPNIIYIVSFDRSRVETALSEQNIPGRDYLEKILQLAVDLPSVPPEILSRQTLDSLDRILRGVEWVDKDDEDRWPDVYQEVVFPLIRNLRDVRRYVASVNGAAMALNGRVALTDLLGLEAVRVFLPDVFARLHMAAAALTDVRTISYGLNNETPDTQTAAIAELVAAGGDRAPAVHSMIERLFPAAHRHVGGSNYGPDWLKPWMRGRRVAHPDNLLLYLERVAGVSLTAFNLAEQAWRVMSDQGAFESLLRKVDQDSLQDVVAALEMYEGEYSESQVIPGVTVLLNLLSEIPDRERGMFDIHKDIVVRRVVLRLLRALEGPEQVIAATRSILPGLSGPSAELHLISILGHKEHEGHKLVSESDAAELERGWREQVRAASAHELAGVDNPLRLFLVAQTGVESGEEPVIVPDAPEVTLALLRSAVGETRSQGMGSRAIQRSPTLTWDALVEVFGGEPELARRVADLGALEPTDSELLTLVARYRDGWRPEEFR